MKTTAGLSFLKNAVAEAVKLEAIRREAAQAEARRRDIPFPDAVDPDALAAEDRLVDITTLARRVVDSTSEARGFAVPVFATPAAGEAMQRLGVVPVVLGAWWACRREGMEGGLPRKGGTTRVMPFLVNGPADAEAWFCFQATQRADGQIYGVIFVRGEENPAVPSSTTDRKDGTNARA